MAAQFKEILKQTIPYYQQGAPLLLEAHAVYEDTATGKLIAQLKWRNLSHQTVQAVNVTLHCKDSFGATLEASTYQYLDVSAAPQGIFGTQNAITLVSERTRQCEVSITGVSFEDGSIWSATEDDTCVALPAGKAQTLSGDLLAQFKWDVTNKGFSNAAQFTPQTYGDLWQCGCGSWQKQDDNTCTSCKATMTQLCELSEPTALAERLASYQQKQEEKRISKVKANAEAEAKRIRLEKEAEVARQTAVKAKKRNIIIASVLAVVVAAVLVFTQVIQPKQKYDAAKRVKYIQAEALLANGEYEEAIKAFLHIGSYHDAIKRGYQIIYNKTMQNTLSGMCDYVRLRADGTVVVVEPDMLGECNVNDWTDIVTVSASYCSHTVGLRADGTVVAVGNNDEGQCNTSDWTDIVAVATGSLHTVGLRADGTVVAVGNNDEGLCDVSDWTDIVAITAGLAHTVGLRADATVVAVGMAYYDVGVNEAVMCDVREWTDIVAVASGALNTIGLRADGTVVADGNNDEGQCNVSDWTDIVVVGTGYEHTVGLRADGTVVAVGNNDKGQCDVSDWTDIVAVSAGNYTTVGLRADGTVVAVGENSQGHVNNWTDIECNLTLQ